MEFSTVDYFFKSDQFFRKEKRTGPAWNVWPRARKRAGDERNSRGFGSAGFSASINNAGQRERRVGKGWRKTGAPYSPPLINKVAA